MKKRQILTIAGLWVGFLIAFLLGYQSLLISAANFLAPTGTGEAQVVILEGTQVVRKGAIEAGRILMAPQKGTRLVVVLHQTAREEELFALPAPYPLLVKRELERLGLKRDQFLIIISPVSHPVTLTEARFVLAELSRSNVRSAILVSEGFHTRRSLRVYEQEGKKRNIRIIPHPYFSHYSREQWWLNTEGMRAFVTEYLKLGYYYLRGYISLSILS